MKKTKHLRPFQNKYLAGLVMTLLVLLSTAAHAREARDTIIPSSITARPTWIGPVDTAWFIVDLQNPLSTRKVSGITILQKAMKYTDSTQMLANYLAAINSHTSQLASHLTSINLNTNAIAVINVNLPKKVDSVKVSGSTLYYYANNGTAYPGGTVSTSGGVSQVNSDWNATSGVAQILNKPSLATVATSGSYTDLSNKPTIPAAQVNSDWNSASGLSQILNKPALDSTGINALHSQAYYDARYLAPINSNTTALGLKAPIASPNFTGTPTLNGTDSLSTKAYARSLLGQTGTAYNLNNEQYYGVKWVSGQTFTMPNTPTKFYYAQVINSSNPTSLYASYTWTSGTSVTINDALQSGDSLVFHYDSGTANGTIASGTPQNGYVPIWNATSGQPVWGAQSGGGTGGPTSIALTTPGVVFSTPVTYNNDGSGNWTGTLSLISQTANKIFGAPLGSNGTPVFRYADSADFGGKWTAEVQAVAGSGSGVTTVGALSANSQTNGASISSNTITFGPADVNGPGMVTNGTQTFGGIKSWFNRQTALTGTNAVYSFLPDINVTSGTTRAVWIAPYDSSSTGGTFRYILDVGTTTGANGTGTYTSALNIQSDGTITTGTGNTTLSGQVAMTKGFGTSFSGANFWAAGTNSPASATLANSSYFGQTSASYRVNIGINNASFTNNTAGYNQYALNVGTSSMYVSNGGGTHPLYANVAIDTPYVAPPTSGTPGTVARVASLFINGSAVKNTLESSQPYSLWIGSTGVFRNDNGVIPGARTTVADANYTLSIYDYNVVFTSLTATRSITPPSNPQPNQHWKIKDESGAAGTSNITFVGTLDGATNPTLISINYGSKTIYYNGTAWFSE